MRSKLLVAVLLVLGGAIWLAGGRAEAIPAFARRQTVSCNACHNPFPRLRMYGKQFAANAFALPGRPEPKDYYRDVGDDNLSLLERLPLSLRADLYFDVHAEKGGQGAASDFKVPWGVRLLSGGRIAEDIGYYLFVLLGDNGEVAGLEDAYLEFNDVFGIPLDVTVGQFQLSNVLFDRELRLTFQDYFIYKAKPAASRSDLTYDRGVMLTANFDFGLELTGIISNGNGREVADPGRDFDPDKFKHFLLRLSENLGPVRFGLFGLYGKEQLDRESDDRHWSNEINIWGSDVTLTLGRTMLNVQYLQRRDIRPDPDTTHQQSPVLTHGFLAEAIVELLGDPASIFVVLMFNWVDSEYLDLKQEAYTANVSWMIKTNIKLMAEYTFAPMVDGLEKNEHRATLGIVTSF